MLDGKCSFTRLAFARSWIIMSAGHIYVYICAWKVLIKHLSCVIFQRHCLFSFRPFKRSSVSQPVCMPYLHANTPCINLDILCQRALAIPNRRGHFPGPVTANPLAGDSSPNRSAIESLAGPYRQLYRMIRLSRTTRGFSSWYPV